MGEQFTCPSGRVQCSDGDVWKDGGLWDWAQPGHLPSLQLAPASSILCQHCDKLPWHRVHGVLTWRVHCRHLDWSLPHNSTGSCVAIPGILLRSPPSRNWSLPALPMLFCASDWETHSTAESFAYRSSDMIFVHLKSNCTFKGAPWSCQILSIFVMNGVC